MKIAANLRPHVVSVAKVILKIDKSFIQTFAETIGAISTGLFRSFTFLVGQGTDHLKLEQSAGAFFRCQSDNPIITTAPVLVNFMHLGTRALKGHFARTKIQIHTLRIHEGYIQSNIERWFVWSIKSEYLTHHQAAMAVNLSFLFKGRLERRD